MTLKEIIQKELETIKKLDTTSINYRGHMGYLLEVKDRIRRLYACSLGDILNYIDYIEHDYKNYD